MTRLAAVLAWWRPAPCVRCGRGRRHHPLLCEECFALWAVFVYPTSVEKWLGDAS